MANDDGHTGHSEHTVEVPLRAAMRRSVASVGVAVCLAIAGLAVAVGIVRDQRATADERTREAVQREQSKNGWDTLSALAAQHSSSVSAAAAPQPTERNVVIVNLPPPVATSPGVVAPVLVSPSASAPSLSTAAAASTTSNAQAPSLTLPPQAPSSSAAPTPDANLSLESAPCGPNTCNSGMVCCNSSCGTCTAPGATCDTSLCSNPITYPASQSCGLSTCNTDSVCCNASCGICTAPGETCTQRACG